MKWNGQRGADSPDSLHFAPITAASDSRRRGASLRCAPARISVRGNDGLSVREVTAAQAVIVSGFDREAPMHYRTRKDETEALMHLDMKM